MVESCQDLAKCWILAWTVHKVQRQNIIRRCQRTFCFQSNITDTKKGHHLFCNFSVYFPFFREIKCMRTCSYFWLNCFKAFWSFQIQIHHSNKFPFKQFLGILVQSIANQVIVMVFLITLLEMCFISHETIET